MKKLAISALLLALSWNAIAGNLGDYAPSTNICGKFTTFQPSTGAAFALAGTPALSVYKDSSTTQSTTGVTLTASFDSVTGLHHYCIDTSADGTFYSAGSNFDVVITTGTVDSVSVVGSVVGSFTIRKGTVTGIPNATAGASGGLLIAGTNADFDVTANASFAGGITITQSTSNGSGLSITGNGTGSGILATGGATGHGISGVGGGTSGNGIRATGTAGNSAALNLVGQGSAAGLQSTGGATDAGASLVGGATSGAGLAVTASAGNSTALTATGQGTGNGATFTSGSGATGNGAQFTAASTSGNGIGLTATGSGVTMTLTPANVTQFGGSAGTFASGRPEVNTTHLGGTAQTGRDIGASVLLSSGTGSGQISLSSGTVTVGTNNDKTGYALSTAGIDAILLRNGIPAPTTIATLASQTSFTLTAGSADDNAYNGYGIVVRDASTASQQALGCVRDYTGSTRTITLLSDPGVFTMATSDNVVLLPAYCDAQVQQDLLDTAFLNCEVNTANFAGSSTTLACILTDKDGAAVSLANSKLTGLELRVLSGTQKYEGRYINATTWDGANSELQLTLSRALPATLADGVIAIIR